jgi:hypothetical protein
VLAEESQSDKVIGFAHKVLLVKKGLVNGFDLSKVVHTESPLSSPSTSICPPAPSSSSSPPSSSSSSGSSSTCLAFLREPVAPAGSAATEKELDVEIE